ncbi:hypothetical protein [Streptomyces sp. WM6378]|uniref:hypothetical protein n=1 Tax=Streptomyces sp. WM6378 TaxID=1415557 RepID=UPI00131C1FBC|nr:hypothetical protein [Streptomyces sp. WM6378]
MTTRDPDQPTPPSQAELSESIAGSSWPEILAATGPIATAVSTVGKAYIEQRGETRRAEINADVERERIQHSSPPPPDNSGAA